jgi:hypothetical protein
MLSWHLIRNELDNRLRNTQNGAALGFAFGRGPVLARFTKHRYRSLGFVSGLEGPEWKFGEEDAALTDSPGPIDGKFEGVLQIGFGQWMRWRSSRK